MLEVVIQDIRQKRIQLKVQNNITVRELNEKYCQSIGSFEEYQYKFGGCVLKYNTRLSDYDIEDDDVIIVNKVIGGGGSHICPYGCGRQIPDEYKGCTELLKDKPNYFG